MADLSTPMGILDDALMDQVRDLARQSDRKRATHRFHQYDEAAVQRMLNAIEPDSYVRPHKHESPDKLETFLALRGRAAVVTYAEDGTVLGGVVVAARGGARGVEIPPRTYHSLFSLEAGTVLYEVIQGPYDPATHKRWAPWAPEEGSAEAASFLANLRRSLGL